MSAFSVTCAGECYRELHGVRRGLKVGLRGFNKGVNGRCAAFLQSWRARMGCNFGRCCFQGGLLLWSEYILLPGQEQGLVICGLCSFDISAEFPAAQKLKENHLEQKAFQRQQTAAAIFHGLLCKNPVANRLKQQGSNCTDSTSIWGYDFSPGRERKSLCSVIFAIYLSQREKHFGCLRQG